MLFPIGDDIGKRNMPVVGIALIIINVFVFLYSTRLGIDPSAGDEPRHSRRSHLAAAAREHQNEVIRFVKAWGVVPTDLAKGRTIGLWSYMFLHVEISHLIGNLVVLWALAGTLENALGSVRFLIYYLLWGLAAGLAQSVMNWGSPQPCIGASGAIAGMMGGYWLVFGGLAKIHFAIFLRLRPYKFSLPAGLVFLLWIVSQFSGLDEQARAGAPRIAYHAHLGGCLAGILTMLPLRREIKSRLALTEEGRLHFKEERAAVKKLEALEAAEPAAPRVTLTCPYCGNPVSEADKITEKLFKCSHAECNRLIYVK